jgi:hypothetical protein
MQVAAATPQAAGRFLAVCPDMSKLLAAVALCKGILRLYASTLMVMWQRLESLNISWDFVVLGSYKEQTGVFSSD